MKQGFIFTAGNKEYFLVSAAQKKTDNVIRAIIEAVGTTKNICRDTIERAKADKATLADFRRRIDAATLQEKTTGNGTRYYTISGKNFSFNYPEADFANDVILIQA